MMVIQKDLVTWTEIWTQMLMVRVKRWQMETKMGLNLG